MVFDLHGQAHRLVAEITNMQFQGARAAASFHKRRGCVSARLHKRMVRFDDAADFLRHVSTVRMQALLDEVLGSYVRKLRRRRTTRTPALALKAATSSSGAWAAWTTRPTRATSSTTMRQETLP